MRFHMNLLPMEIRSLNDFYTKDKDRMRELAKNKLANKKGGGILNVRAWDRDYDRKAEKLVISQSNAKESIARYANAEIERRLKDSSSEQKDLFDNLAGNLVNLMHEFLLAEDKTDLLYLARLYNQGGPIKEALLKLKNKSDEKINHSDDLSDGGSHQLQEEQSIAPTGATSATESESTQQQPGHQQKRELQNDHHLGDNPTGYGNDIMP